MTPTASAFSTLTARIDEIAQELGGEGLAVSLYDYETGRFAHHRNHQRDGGLAIVHAEGDAATRVTAHSRIPSDAAHVAKRLARALRLLFRLRASGFGRNFGLWIGD